MERNGLVELEIKHGDDKIFLKRCPPHQPTMTSAPTFATGQTTAHPPADLTKTPANNMPTSATQEEADLVEIKSPIVGTFYATPSPDSEPYVEIGSHVDPQTVVSIVEAMKVMNEIKAETSGTIVEILVTNGQAVEYGQVLFKVRLD